MSTTGPFWRAYPAQIERVSEGVLSGRLVPYGMSTDVVDFLPTGPELYREGFRPGAFAPQAMSENKAVALKIGLVHRHEGGLGYLGPFVRLRDAADGLYGEAQIMPTLQSNVEALLRAGVTELSVEFRLRGSEREATEIDEDGVRWRTKAHLDQVALEPKGAYSGAAVLGYRADADDLARLRAEESARREAEEAERAAAEQAERDLAAKAAAEEAERVERRREWDEMVARVPTLQEQQQALIRQYGE